MFLHNSEEVKKWYVRAQLKCISAELSMGLELVEGLYVSSVLDVLQRWCQGESRLAEWLEIIDILTRRL